MAKFLVAFLSVLMLIVWVIGILGSLYFIFRIVLLQYEMYERTGFKIRAAFSQITAEDQRKLREYALKAFLCFAGFLVIEFVLEFLRDLVS